MPRSCSARCGSNWGEWTAPGEGLADAEWDCEGSAVCPNLHRAWAASEVGVMLIDCCCSSSMLYGCLTEAGLPSNEEDWIWSEEWSKGSTVVCWVLVADRLLNMKLRVLLLRTYCVPEFGLWSVLLCLLFWLCLLTWSVGSLIRCWVRL